MFILLFIVTICVNPHVNVGLKAVRSQRVTKIWEGKEQIDDNNRCDM
jgi:hypothetical protein